ncbi:MAG TPA: XdhC/CoxI family protein [Mycobacteriales bacterium]|nr:XdhC/CoxI family protein [Mycobacteriales bacterium]
MRDIAAGLRPLLAAGQPFAMATIVGVSGSSPRPPGTAMVVDTDGAALGSLSGGCVEGAVYTAAEEVLETGIAVVETYGISDDDAFAVGLTCGGVLDVLVHRVAGDELDQVREVLDALDAHEPIAVATVIGGPAPLGARLVVSPVGTTGSLGAVGLDAAVTDDTRGLLAAGRDGVRHYGANGERRLDDVTVITQSFTPPARMLVFGAIDFAAAVARLGVFLGYHVTVCDARPVFANPARFPEAHEVVCEWPHDYLARTAIDERTVMCVLTHDPKFDVPLLEVALRSPASYIGAMGSRRTHEDRLARLRERGVSEAALARLHSPVGLDIGARTPEETAVSIAAEIVLRRWGGTGRRLSDIEGAIHRDTAAEAAATAGS